MFSNNEQSWLFNCLAGVVVLVLAGVGLSTLANKRFELSRNTLALEKEVAADETRVVHLRARGRALSMQLGEHPPQLHHKAKTLLETQVRNNDLVTRKQQLQSEKDNLELELEKLGQSFAALRSRTQQAIRAKAVGESLGNLKTTSGRKYNDAVITQITAAGLQIRHAYGLARIPAHELPRKLQERFQWTTEERQSRTSTSTPVTSEQ